MLAYSKDGITVSPILDDRRPRTQGTYPIKIRVTYQRSCKYYSTGKELSKEDWGRLENTKSPLLREIKASVENSFSLVKKNVEALAEHGDFTFDILNVRLGKATGDTVNNAFKARIAMLKKEERIGTMLFYDNILKNVEKFAGSNLTFNAITVDWLKRFEKFLLKDKNRTTTGMHMRAIRAIMNEARKAGVIKETRYPFGKGRYEIRSGESKKKALSLQDIGRVIKFSDGTDTTEYYRDLWFFMYLCNGINVTDLVKLKYKDIEDDEICFVRQKTERTSATVKDIYASLTPEMKQIIKRWGNEPNPDSYIFKCLNEAMDAVKRKKYTKDFTKRINKRMKLIGKALGIEGISTYTARHSYATILKNKGVPIAFISESLGHNDLKTTESYLASFEKKERHKNAAFLLQFDDEVIS